MFKLIYRFIFIFVDIATIPTVKPKKRVLVIFKRSALALSMKLMFKFIVQHFVICT